MLHDKVHDRGHDEEHDDILTEILSSLMIDEVLNYDRKNSNRSGLEDVIHMS